MTSQSYDNILFDPFPFKAIIFIKKSNNNIQVLENLRMGILMAKTIYNFRAVYPLQQILDILRIIESFSMSDSLAQNFQSQHFGLNGTSVIDFLLYCSKSVLNVCNFFPTFAGLEIRDINEQRILHFLRSLLAIINLIINIEHLSIRFLIIAVIQHMRQLFRF